MQILRFAVHTAYLDPMIGAGILVQPDPEDDIDPPSGDRGEPVWLPDLEVVGRRPALSFHWADWEAALRRLHDLAYYPQEGGDGDLDVVGTTDDGRTAIALYGENPVVSDPELGDIDQALRDLCAAAGVHLS